MQLRSGGVALLEWTDHAIIKKANSTKNFSVTPRHDLRYELLGWNIAVISWQFPSFYLAPSTHSITPWWWHLPLCRLGLWREGERENKALTVKHYVETWYSFGPVLTVPCSTYGCVGVPSKLHRYNHWESSRLLDYSIIFGSDLAPEAGSHMLLVKSDVS